MRKGSNSGLRSWPWALALMVAVGCAPELGDPCERSTDCSVQGDRLCDISAPGGYCTLAECVAGGCQGEGYCVRFEPDQLRLASSWCMAKCKRGCRDGYRCASVQELNAERCGISPDRFERLSDEEQADALKDCREAMPRVAELLDDKPGAEFCVQELPESLVTGN